LPQPGDREVTFFWYLSQSATYYLYNHPKAVAYSKGEKWGHASPGADLGGPSAHFLQLLKMRFKQKFISK